MAASRSSIYAAVASVLAVLVAATAGAGCGKSELSSDHSAAPAQSTARRDPPSAARTSTATTSAPSPTASTTGTARAARASAIPPAHPVPAAFQPAPGASSDAEVRAELAQLAATQRSEYIKHLSAAAANLAGLLPWSLEPKSGVQVSVASEFTDYGLGLACGGVLGRNQLGVAHKTAPCGTLITFTYGSHSITVPVIDRGPYIAGREWDFTGATAAALGFPGLAQVTWTLAR